MGQDAPFPWRAASNLKGCDALLSNLCLLSATVQMCSCDAANPGYESLSDGVCFDGCAEHKRNIRGGLTDHGAFFVPKMMNDQVQKTDINQQGNEWLLVNPVGTSSKIGVVGPAGKSSYLGQNLAGYAESFQGRCWNHRDEYSIYNKDEFTEGYFPHSAKGYTTRCDVANASDPRFSSTFDNSSLTHDQKMESIIQQLRDRVKLKYQNSRTGLLGQFPQDIVLVDDQLARTWTKECNANGTMQQCSSSCTCVNDEQFSTQWHSPDQLSCADTSCSDPGYGADGNCPAIVCTDEGEGKRRRLEATNGCVQRAEDRQLVFLSPSYEKFTSADDVDKYMWEAQKLTMSGSQKKYTHTDAREAMEQVDKNFLSAAYIFNSLDASSLKFDVTFESYFTEVGEQCDFISTYALASVRREQSTDALHPCNFMKAEWRSNPWFPPLSDNWNLVSNTFYFGLNNNPAVSSANWMLNALSSAIFKNEGLGESITTGFNPLPDFPADGKDLENFVNIFKNVFGYFVIGACICMTLSPLLTAMVQEKELKLQSMMRMMGMEDVVYQTITYGWNFLFTFTFNLWLYISGLIAGNVYSGDTLFTRTDGLIFVLLIIVYSHAQTMFCILLGNFFQNTKRVGVASFMIMMFALIAMLVLNRIFDEADWGGKPAPFYLMLVPPFAMFRALELMYVQTIVWETLTPEHELSAVFGWLILGSFICFVLDAYLSQVLPRQYGVRQPWNFPCKKLVAAVRRKLDAKKGEDEPKAEVAAFDAGQVHEDSDVKMERESVLAGKFDVENSQLLTYHLRKMYGTFTAVNDLTFHVAKGECFGLLGPNGAGKTTAISMLTGLFPSTNGNARVCGFDLKKQLRQIYDVMGICPQFDICWPDISVAEHVALYARIKGVVESHVTPSVTKILQEVGLEEAKSVLSKDLSGGMRRRLSLAMALVGDPQVVFLDEPTTGLDPETRRNIWALLDKVKVGRCIILTTHSMDEADALCGRIGIMSHGLMRCIGTNLHLKNRYGNGYKVEIRFDPGNLEKANTFVMDMLHQKASILSTTKDTRVYQVVKDNVVLSEVFRKMQERDASIGILDYGVRQTSLEEVFLKIAKESEAAFQQKKNKK